MRQQTCRSCRQPVPTRPVIEDQSRNGVSVRVFRFENGGTVVDASCQCFGIKFRLHSSERCPLRLRLIAREAAWTDALFVVTSIHDGSDVCVLRATAGEVAEERAQGEGWAMSYESAVTRARASARRHNCRWFDFSADPPPERETSP